MTGMIELMKEQGYDVQASREDGLGVKFDNGKLRWSLLPDGCIDEVLKVLEVGALKYGDYNWLGFEKDQNRVYNSLMRHIQAWKKGEALDDETGISHIAHAMCNCLFLLHFHLEKQKSEPGDTKSSDSE
jgi:hypothetical protein